MLGRLWRRLRALLRRDSLDSELDTELRYHIERQVAEYVSEGMTQEEARRAAVRDFGGVTQSKERCREARGVRPLEDLRQDILFGLRVLRRNPVFSLVAVVTLALGIGANTALFSITNAVIFRPLPFPEPERLMTLWESAPKSEEARNIVSPANYLDWRAQTRSFEEMGAYTEDFYNISEDDSRPERVAGINATPSLFQTLGVRPLLGRVFRPEEGEYGAPNVVMLSYGLWQRRFGGDPNVVGKTVKMNGPEYTVVGVLPPDFILSPRRYEVIRSIVFDDRQRVNRRGRYLTVVARLRPGVTPEQARAEMRAVGARLAESYPDENAGRSATTYPLDRWITWGTRATLLTLLGAVGFTLLIACANVANLLLGQAAGRRKEMAVRAALGAGRLRLVRQMLTESLTLSLLGGLAGLLLAKWGVRLLVSLSPASLPRAEEAGLDPWVLCFTLAVSVVTGLAFGLAPALQASKVELTDALKSVRSTGDGRRSLARGALVAAEVALSLVLLVGAGLLVKSFIRLTEVELGFDPTHVVAADISLPYRYNTQEKRTEVYRQILTRVERLPGVASAAVAQSVPLSGEEHGAQFMVVGRPPAPDGSDRHGSIYHRVSEGYFKTLGVRLLKGRYLNERDTAGAPRVALVNESLARRVFPGEDPLGKQIILAGDSTPRPREIVGVVSDTRYVAPNIEPFSQIYVSYLSEPWFHMSLIVRATGDPAALMNGLREEVSAVDREVPLANVKEMEQYVSDSLSPQRFSALLLALFAAAALGLAALGVYGVISNSVARRTHEIGIRIALGARRRDVLRLVVGQGMRPVLLGLAAGLAGALALTRLMESLLYGVSAFDPTVFAGVSLLLAATALVACYLPARRATQVDPMTALRHE
ncbi:MAG TPA: ABC transporter permease [Pyrinomonadaceae bacterium]|nr:ABC transporter permease [Pyrinomonadaceae bacterium]